MPNRIRDISGQIFGNLTAIKFLRTNDKKRAIWECNCSCGRVVEIESVALLYWGTKSCGDVIHRTKIIVGNKYNKWLVLGYSRVVNTISGNHYSLWLAQCECGRVKEVVGENILKGNSKGCLICSLTKHGLYHTREYKNHKWREYYEKKRELDGEWTLEMTMALRSYYLYCVLCGMTLQEHYNRYGQMLHIDHMRPLSKKFGLKLGNAVVLCYSCNTSKTNKDLGQLTVEKATKLSEAAEQFKQAWESGYRA